MDNLKRETGLFWPVIMSAPLGPILRAGAIILLLSACGGGGGGGGGGSAPQVVVTQNPAIRGDDRLPLSFGGAASVEYQRGRSDVAGSNHCLICSAEAVFESWELAYQMTLGSPALDSSVSGSGSKKFEVILHQPLHVTSASFDIVSAEQQAVSVRPSRPQREAIMRLTSRALGGSLGLSHHMMTHNLQGGFAHQLMANWTLSF